MPTVLYEVGIAVVPDDDPTAVPTKQLHSAVSGIPVTYNQIVAPILRYQWRD